MVGAGGFEPPMPVPKTGALPLGYAPKEADKINCLVLVALIMDDVATI